MTLFDMVWKMIKYNLRKYHLLFTFNCGLTAICFCFVALLTDERFMDERVIDSMISGNIYFPAILMMGLMVFFLPFSYGVFLDSGKRDYGILLSLGVNRRSALLYLAIEGLAVMSLALFAALGIGTVLSLGFYMLLHYVIGINEICWNFHLTAYLTVTVLYMLATVFTVLVQAFKMMQQRIIQMLKTPYQVEKRGLSYEIMKKLCCRYMRENMLRHSFLLRHRREWRTRTLVSGLIISTVLFFVCFSVSLAPSFYRDADIYAPFDMTYAEIWGLNCIPSDEVENCLRSNMVRIKSAEQISFVRDANCNYVSVNDINDKLGCDYTIDRGQFLNLFQYEMGDGYEHDIEPIKNITINAEGQARTLESAGSDIRVLWNLTPAMADRTLLLNDDDFKELSGDRNYFAGNLHLYRFYEGSGTEKGVMAAQMLLDSANRLPESEQWNVRISARVLDYKRARQSVELLLFLTFFVVSLLYASEYILIHFRILAEREENKRAVKSLYLLGLTKAELYRFILSKNRVRFLLPVLIGTVLAACILGVCLLKTYGFGVGGFLLSLLLGGLLSGIIYFRCAQYSRRELRDLLIS